MEKKTNLRDVVKTLRDEVEKICRRRHQMQNDEDLLKEVIDRLNSHSCTVNCDRTTEGAEKEKLMNALQRAREERDEYKFQLNVCKSKIKELKEELGAARLNQTQHNISVTADLSHIGERESCAYSNKSEPGGGDNTEGELNRIHTVSKETLERELNYLHKTNENFLAKIRKLQSDLVSQDQLMETLKMKEEEITKLKKTLEEKNAKIMDMQVKFDEQLKKCKIDFNYQISMLETKILDLEGVRDTQKIDLEEAYQEIKLLKFSLKKPEEEAAEHSSSIKFPAEPVANSEQMLSIAEKETSDQKGVLLNVTKRRVNRGKLQPIENIVECQNSSFTSLSEQFLTKKLQVTVDEVKDMCSGVTKGTKRTQKGTKGSKKELPVSQKKEAKQATRKRAPGNAKRKARDCNKVDGDPSNKLLKKSIAELEMDENVEPCSFESSSPSFNGMSGKSKLTEDTLTPRAKRVKKGQDNAKKPANRRRNK